ncbi:MULTISPECIES: site-specific integrase [unclassified Dysgonomonas]|uniref:site-specific integrase n=1 Tax=unclassified Dysgonomonas TaxID=2630389 RepID=UPI0025C696E6|nr:MULTISPECIES: site-specific integrase [unclassified Dysgonomonas]
MRSTFKLLFYINKQKIKANGNCPIMGRITLDGKICQYSTGEEISPALWDADSGRVIIRDNNSKNKKELKSINSRLEELELKAKTTYKKSSDTIGYVSAEIIKNALLNRAQAKETLIALLDEHNQEYALRVGIDRVRHTYIRYITSRKHIYNFLQYKYGIEDIPLRSLDMQFINDFNFYLSTVLKLKLVSLNDYLIVLRKMTRLAIKQRTLKRDPFAGHRLDKAPKIHRHLTSEQLDKVMNVELYTYRLCHTRDLFVFSVFTGLGRAELANLTSENIITKKDGSKWIYIARQKTKAECYIKLLDIPIRIMDKYKGEGEEDKIFYVPQTSSLCRSLKMIEDLCKLDCHLTFYVGRHSKTCYCLLINILRTNIFSIGNDLETSLVLRSA